MAAAIIPSQRVELVPAPAASQDRHRPAWALGDSTKLRIAGAAVVVRLAPCQHCDASLLGVSQSADDADPTWYVVDGRLELTS